MQFHHRIGAPVGANLCQKAAIARASLPKSPRNGKIRLFAGIFGCRGRDLNRENRAFRVRWRRFGQWRGSNSAVCREAHELTSARHRDALGLTGTNDLR